MISTFPNNATFKGDLVVRGDLVVNGTLTANRVTNGTKVMIGLEKKQWEMVEKCVCLILQQVESLQRDLTPPLPPTNFDTKELCRIRGGLSFGYAMKGEGVTESIIRSKDHKSFVEPKPKPRETAKIYHVCFDHQLEPRDYGNFSTFDKAHDFLVNDRELDIKDIAKYGTTTIYKTSHGDYRIEEKVLI